MSCYHYDRFFSTVEEEILTLLSGDDKRTELASCGVGGATTVEF